MFVAVLSMGFLEKKLRGVEWAGILFVLGGLSVVGVSDFLSTASSGDAHKDTNSIITGTYIYFEFSCQRL